MTCVFCIDADTIIWLFVCADVGPRGCEVEMIRVSARPELGRPPWERERCRHKNVEVRPASDERGARRHHFDGLGDGPSHAPPSEAGGDFEDIFHYLEVVLQGGLRECGHTSRMRASWSSVWECR
jgi:hypothetical protein